MPNYVAHICRNKKCNAIWVDKDLTGVKTNPPAWKYCKECAEKMGIDFDNQKPSDYLTDEEKEMRKIKMEKAKLALKQKINSEIPKGG